MHPRKIFETLRSGVDLDLRLTARWLLLSSLVGVVSGCGAILLSLAGFSYVRVFYGTHALFKRLPIPRHLRPALGAGLAGLFGLLLWSITSGDRTSLAVLSTGYRSIQEALDPAASVGAGILVIVALGKIITTSLTISSGGSGGVFGPSMVIGGCLGGAAGQLAHSVWPAVVSQPRSWVIIGMAGFFAGCAHAPFSTIVMVSEMTGDYKLLLPAMWISTLCFLLSRRWSIYQKQVPTRLDSPAHRGDFLVDVLRGLKVRDILDPSRAVTTVPESTTMERVLRLLAETSQSYFPVVDDSGRMVGIFTAKDLRPYTYQERMWQVTIARDLMVTDILSVVPEDDLNTALRRFTAKNLDELPVVDPDDPGKLVGMVRRKDAISLYNGRLSELRGRAED